MYEFGVDFIARCLAGEAIGEAKKKQWKLIAGDNIILQDNEENETTTISAIDTTDVIDDELSLVSENPVQNKVITAALQYKPDTYTGDVKTANQKIVQLTRAQYDAIENKDPNTYYMITDDISYVVRTAYIDVTPDVEITVDSNTGSYYISFDAPANFTMLEARINYEITWSCGSWSNAKSGLTSILTITPDDTAPPREGRKIYMGVTEDKWLGTAPNQTHINEEKATLIGANYITYDEVTNKIRIEISKPIYNYVNIDPDDLDNTVLTINDFEVSEVGYVAYGSDNINITETTYTAGTGIAIDNNGEISLDADYGATFELSMNSSTYVITAVLKDQNGNTLSTQTIDLPLESVVVSGSYDSTTKTIILTLEGGSTISIPVGDLVSGLESTSNKVTSISSSSTNDEYPSAKCVYDAVDAVKLPASTIPDQGKVLTVNSSGEPVWQTPSSGVTDYDLLNNRPSINSVTLTGNKTAADLGLVVPTDLNDYLTTASAANTYQTQAGMSNYLSTTAAAQTYQPIGTYLVPSDLNGYATQTWVGQQGYLVSSDLNGYATQTWVNNQGFLTSADEVPTVTSSDNGKVLKATYSGGIGSYSWETAPSGLPSSTSADEGKVLTVDSNGDAEWANLPSVDEVPAVTSNDDGKVLTATYSGGVGSYAWATGGGGGGGLSVETDGTNYWITVNGIRLYFASSAPSGTIPDGSMGIGW